ncbi:hypothetical protein KBC99_00960 [Candidatus Saccharibacteria bacterium]|nr:hypothetical protein [Candidatus Saccharibacteria bacterium]
MTNDAPSSEQDIYDSGVEMAYKANDALTDALEAQARLSAGEENKSLNPSDRAALIDQAKKAHARYDRYNDAVGSLIGPQVFKEKPSIAPRRVEKAPDVKKPIERVAEYPPRGGHDFFRQLISKVLDFPDPFSGSSTGEKLLLYDDSAHPLLHLGLEADVPDPKAGIINRVRYNGARWAEAEVKARGNESLVKQAIGLLADLCDRIAATEKSGNISELAADSFRRFIAQGFSVGSSVDHASTYARYYHSYHKNSQHVKQTNTENAQAYYALKDTRLAQAQWYRNTVGSVTTTSPNTDWIQFVPPIKSGEYTDRIYISLQPNQEALRHGVNAWMKALEQTGAIDRVHFKIGTDPNRLDTIVVYPTAELESQTLEQLLETFTKLCPARYRDAEPALTGIELAPGIAYATEPESIALIAKLMRDGNQRTSFGDLMSGLAQLAMQVAYVEVGRAMPNGQGPRQSTVVDTAERIFNQYLILLDIDPNSFVPNSRGGRLPDWAQHIRDTHAKRPQ